MASLDRPRSFSIVAVKSMRTDDGSSSFEAKTKNNCEKFRLNDFAGEFGQNSLESKNSILKKSALVRVQAFEDVLPLRVCHAGSIWATGRVNLALLLRLTIHQGISLINGLIGSRFLNPSH